MPNIVSVLKEEIRRLAKREIKAATGSTKQAVAQYRRDIAKLKRLVQAQQKAYRECVQQIDNLLSLKTLSIMWR